MLELRNISWSTPDGVPILRDLSLTIENTGRNNNAGRRRHNGT